MKIIYHCYGGRILPSGGCSHLGIFNPHKFPRFKELLSCPYFDKVKIANWE